VTDVGFDLQKVIGVAVEDTRMKAHDLHQSHGASAAYRSRLQPGILSQEDARKQAGRELQLPRLLDDRTSDSIRYGRIAATAENLSQRQVIVPGDNLPFQADAVCRAPGTAG
jgi:hypothetical protein